MDAGEAVGLKNIGKRRLLHNRQAQRGLDRVRDVVKSIDCTRSCTAGMRLEPPTISTLLICEMETPESLMA